MDLTKRQQEIFDFIKRYSARYGYPPTVRDIGKAVGLASSSTVHAHLATLERSACCSETREAAGDRAARPRGRRGAELVRPGLPLLGRSPPASRSWPRRTSRSTSRCPPSPAATRRVSVAGRGDSMVDVGILDGDLVVVRPQKSAENGQIVVAMVEASRGDREALLSRTRSGASAARER